MVIKKLFTLSILWFLFTGTAGCGLLYTNVVRQHSTDYNKTPVGSKSCSLSAFTVRVPLLPVTRQRVQAQWDRDEISDVLSAAGMTTIHFTDLETQEFLLGTFRRVTIIFYGD
jgi:hypothetical protein